MRSFRNKTKDERLSRPGWLTYSGRYIHISGHPPDAGQAQEGESSLVKDQCSTTVSQCCYNNNNNNQDNVYGAVIMAEPLREFTRFI